MRFIMTTDFKSCLKVVLKATLSCWMAGAGQLWGKVFVWGILISEINIPASKKRRN